VDADAARRMGADDASDDAWQGVEKIKRLLAGIGSGGAGRGVGQ